MSERGWSPRDTRDFTNGSSGTAIVADPSSGGSATGTVSVVDASTRKVVSSIDVANHPTSVHTDGKYVFVANTNSDTISVIDASTRSLVKTIDVKPFPGAPTGSSPQSVTTLPGSQLAVALGNSNALASYHWSGPIEPARFQGLLPTAWYPGDVAVDTARKSLVVANVKGIGSVVTPPTRQASPCTRGSAPRRGFPCPAPPTWPRALNMSSATTGGTA